MVSSDTHSFYFYWSLSVEQEKKKKKTERSVLHPPLLCQVDVVMATTLCSPTCYHGWDRRIDDAVY